MQVNLYLVYQIGATGYTMSSEGNSDNGTE
jgi:hypothetical protein